MCGIVGYVGSRSAGTMLIEGLKRLEYRGYDSAGIAMSNGNGLETRKAKGKISMLESLVGTYPIHGTVGIAHTRWATHGAPSELNAHPQTDCTNTIAVVHNGIIENYSALRKMLQMQGHTFKSDTDTEVLAHLIEAALPDEPLEDAVIDALNLVQGTYGIAVLSSKEPGKIVCARQGQPAPHRPRRRRELRGERRRGDSQAHAPSRLSRRRRDGRADEGRLRGPRPERAPRVEGREPDRLVARRDREGRVRALHAQGDLRAAADDPEHDARPARRRRRLLQARRAESHSGRAAVDQPCRDHRLRHELALRVDRRDVHRGMRSPARGSRVRFGVPLPQPDRRRQDVVRRDLAVGRDRGHARRDARSEAPRGEDARPRERRRLDDRARGQRRHLSARRSRDRRRVDQGVHEPGHRARSADAEAGAPAQHVGRGGQEHGAGDARAPRPDSDDSRHGAGDREARRPVQERDELLVPRPRVQFPCRARRARSNSRKSATSTPRGIRRRR